MIIDMRQQKPGYTWATAQPFELTPRLTVVQSIRSKKAGRDLIGWRSTCYTCHTEQVWMPHDWERAVKFAKEHPCKRSRNAR